MPASVRSTVGPAVHPTAGLAQFVMVLRRMGVEVPMAAIIRFSEAIAELGLRDRDGVYWAGRATLIIRPEDIEVYDLAFGWFWEGANLSVSPHSTQTERTTLAVDDSTDDSDDLESDSGEESEVLRFSRVEQLAVMDIAQCTPQERAEIDAMISALRFSADHRRSRRQRRVRRRTGRHDLGATIELALRHHGEPLRWVDTAPKSRPRRLVLILDVSGSMQSYARALLRFAHAAAVARGGAAAGGVEVFTLGTRLTRVTRVLAERDPDEAMRRVGPEISDWSGGTRLGEALATFNDEWGIKGLARGAVVVILSDGWDRGDPQQLAMQMERLHRVTHQLVWVNPLKAAPDYAPLAAGMAAALPHVDRFLPAASYANLVDLADAISGYRR